MEQGIVLLIFVLAFLAGIIAIFINIIIADGIFLGMFVSDFLYHKLGLHIAISILIALLIAIALPAIFSRFNAAFYIITGAGCAVAAYLGYDLARELNLDNTWRVVFAIIAVGFSLGAHFMSKEKLEERGITIRIKKD